MRLKVTVILLMVFLVAALAALGVRLYYLQFLKFEFYVENSKRQQTSIITKPAQRGTIFDNRGNVLAASNTADEVFIEPRRLASSDDIKETAMKLQDILHLPGPDICSLVYESKNQGYVRIQSGISREQREAIQALRIAGVGIRSPWQRYYPMGILTGHVVGFMGAENKGLAGLELKYDGILQGRDGREVYLVDVARNPIGYRPDMYVQPMLGQNLILTIDSTLQQFVRAALLKQMKAYEAESAVGIMMEPKTGAILAMVSLPDYDPDRFNTEKAEHLKNRILTDPYEPGSIIKPIVAAIALDRGSISTGEIIYCEDGYWGKYRIGEFGNHRYGNFTVREILVHSSNVGMAKIGLKMGQKKLYDGMKLFGFGDKTGIDLPGEDSGLLYPTSKWSGYSVTRIPFGHEIMVSSIQIARAYCVLANGGSLVTPHVVKAVVDSQGQVTKLYQSTSDTGFIIKPKIAKWVVNTALVGVVTEGTGDKAALEDVQVWGKTGTANIALPGGGYDTSNYVASFVGGAPAENPQVVLMVSIRKPNRALGQGYSGGRVAAPVAGEILKQALPYLKNGY